MSIGLFVSKFPIFAKIYEILIDLRLLINCQFNASSPVCVAVNVVSSDRIQVLP